MSQEQLTVMTRKGQITIPAAIRRALGIKVGDKVALSIREGARGEAVLRPARSAVEATYGIAGTASVAADPDVMREQFERGLAQDAVAGQDGPDQDR